MAVNAPDGARAGSQQEESGEVTLTPGQYEVTVPLSKINDPDYDILLNFESPGTANPPVYNFTVISRAKTEFVVEITPTGPADDAGYQTIMRWTVRTRTA
jgi:hypothetical protein